MIFFNDGFTFVYNPLFPTLRETAIRSNSCPQTNSVPIARDFLLSKGVIFKRDLLREGVLMGQRVGFPNFSWGMTGGMFE